MECQCHNYGFPFKLPSTAFQAVTAWEAFILHKYVKLQELFTVGALEGIKDNVEFESHHKLSERTNPLYPIQSVLITSIHR